MKKLTVLIFLLLIACLETFAQYAFELKIDYSMRIQNSDQFSVSGVILKGRVEKGKTYFLEDGTKVVINNLISAKSATSVPVAVETENVSLGLTCKDFVPTHGDILKANTTQTQFSGNTVKYNANQLKEGMLTCKLNGRMYEAMTVSKPVYIRNSNILDLFFKAKDESVIWLQINGFSDIENAPHKLSSDTSQADKSLLCKVAYLPNGYRPTDMPNNYVAFEDLKGNSGLVIVSLNKYKKNIALEFSGILRPNKRLLEEKPEAGLFYLTLGRVDNISWDEF